MQLVNPKCENLFSHCHITCLMASELRCHEIYAELVAVQVHSDMGTKLKNEANAKIHIRKVRISTYGEGPLANGAGSRGMLQVSKSIVHNGETDEDSRQVAAVCSYATGDGDGSTGSMFRSDSCDVYARGQFTLEPGEFAAFHKEIQGSQPVAMRDHAYIWYEF